MSNCPGVREDDTVRPLQMCQQCQHWLSTTGERVYPAIVLQQDGDGVTVLCVRRQPVKG